MDLCTPGYHNNTPEYQLINLFFNMDFYVLN
jgi:hypothetical protein